MKYKLILFFFSHPVIYSDIKNKYIKTRKFINMTNKKEYTSLPSPVGQTSSLYIVKLYNAQKGQNKML